MRRCHQQPAAVDAFRHRRSRASCRARHRHPSSLARGGPEPARPPRRGRWASLSATAACSPPKSPRSWSITYCDGAACSPRTSARRMASCAADPELELPDIELIFAPAPFYDEALIPPEGHGVMLRAHPRRAGKPRSDHLAVRRSARQAGHRAALPVRSRRRGPCRDDGRVKDLRPDWPKLPR